MDLLNGRLDILRNVIEDLIILREGGIELEDLIKQYDAFKTGVEYQLEQEMENLFSDSADFLFL